MKPDGVEVLSLPRMTKRETAGDRRSKSLTALDVRVKCGWSVAQTLCLHGSGLLSYEE